MFVCLSRIWEMKRFNSYAVYAACRRSWHPAYFQAVPSDSRGKYQCVLVQQTFDPGQADWTAVRETKASCDRVWRPQAVTHTETGYPRSRFGRFSRRAAAKLRQMTLCLYSTTLAFYWHIYLLCPRSYRIHGGGASLYKERKCADTTGTMLVPRAAISNAKIQIYFQIKYTEAILSNSTRTPSRFEIIKMLIEV